MGRRPGSWKMESLQKGADRIAFLIVATDLPEIDLVLEEEKLRQECEALFPDRMELFEMIYTSRFKRLKEQFRGKKKNPVRLERGGRGNRKRFPESGRYYKKRRYPRCFRPERKHR